MLTCVCIHQWRHHGNQVPSVGGTVDAAISPSIAMLVATAKDAGIYLIGGSVPEKEVQADGSTNVLVTRTCAHLKTP